MIGLYAVTGLVVLASWAVFAIVWLAGAFRVRRSKRNESVTSRSSHGLLILVGALLLVPDRYPGSLGEAVIAMESVRDVVGATLVVLGVALAVWARTFLGKNWSARVTLKEGHELIQSGPYRLARHPIYTGVILAVAGSAIRKGSIGPLLAVPCFTVGFLLKIRLEERWLAEEFGEQYRAYRQRVKALIPFVL